MTRGWLGWTTLAVVLAVVLGTSVAAYRLASYSWNQVVDYRSPFTAIGRPSTDAGPAQTPRLVLVIVDGLRLDASRRMSSLNGLRDYGTSLDLTVPQPSLSFPNWTTILTGAPQTVSGVTTNWYSGRVRVQTLVDSALAAGCKTVVVGPSSMEELYGVGRADAVYLRDWKEGGYLSADLVTHTLQLVDRVRPSFVLLHLPDVDAAGHAYGGASKEYAATATKVDRDLARLVESMRDGKTTFVVVADHGHIDAGGHGGWDAEAVHVPGVFAGAGVALGGQGNGRLEDVAPTVAALLGIPVPAESLGSVQSVVLQDRARAVLEPADAQRDRAFEGYARRVAQGGGIALRGGGSPAADLASAEAARAASDRRKRLPLAAALALAAIAALVANGLASRRALVAALVGCGAYYAVYDGLYFFVHGYRWSLSSFNSESLLKAFFNGRMLEAAAAGLLAALVAGFAYAAQRAEPKGPRQGYGAGWATLGGVTVLAIQATLAIQVAWFLWRYGASVTWALPDFRWGFKYDLDLIQSTALGAAAVLGPVVTYLVGRYHPRVSRMEARRAQGESD